MNKDPEQPISLSEAKKIVRKHLGRPLKLGYCIEIGNCKYYRLELIRFSSGYWLHSYTDPFMTPDLSQFKIILK